jgi:hypothetical protein
MWQNGYLHPAPQTDHTTLMILPCGHMYSTTHPDSPPPSCEYLDSKSREKNPRISHFDTVILLKAEAFVVVEEDRFRRSAAQGDSVCARVCGEK